jgi:hypothetical protein
MSIEWVDKHSREISKGADASPQTKLTNNQTVEDKQPADNKNKHLTGVLIRANFQAC